ncbi:MAG: TonB-dependent receptor [Rikenellaceae bacterium]|nr:TonB-dependent receptor [Rikenellaceae bacterium]
MMCCRRKFLVILLLSLLTLGVKGQTPQADSSQVAVATVESEMIFDPNTDDVNYLQISDVGSTTFRLRQYGLGHILLNSRGDIFSQAQFRIDGVSMYNPAQQGALWGVISGYTNLQQFDVERLAPFGSRQLEQHSQVSYSRFRALLGSNSASRIRNFRFSLTNPEFLSRGRLHLAGRARWGMDRTFDGAFVENYAFNGSFSRSLNKYNELTVSAMATYSERGLKSCAMEESFALVKHIYGSKFYGYNPTVGLQNGKTRNAATSMNKALLLNVKHKFVSESGASQVSTSLTALHNKMGYSTLARFDSDNPYPDYYAYLPSHNQGENAQQITELWQTDKSISQLDWNNLYQINYANGSADGVRSKHIVEQRVTSHKSLRANISAIHQFSKRLSVELFADVGLDRSDYYKVVDDLLGGDYWLDIDTYLVDDVYYGDMVQNNLPTPNRRVKEGDAFGYNYLVNSAVVTAGLFARYQYGGVRLAAQYSRSKSWVSRYGRYEKETFPGALSVGRSEWRSFDAESFSMSADYVNHNGLKFLLKLASESKIPTYREIFIAPKNQNRFVDSPRSARFTSAEIGLAANRHWGTFRVTAFSNRAKSVNYIVNQYDVITTRYSQFVTNNLSTRSYGVEVEAVVEIAPQIEFAGFFSSGRYQYDSNPIFTQYDDRDGKVLNENIIAHISGRPVHYAPKHLLMGAVRWQAYRGLWADATISYTSPRSAKLDMLRRTDRIITLTDRLDVRERLLAHTNLNEVCTIDLSAGKRFRVGKHALTLTVGINNLTDSKIERYGYEQYHLTKVGSGYGRYYDAAEIKKCYDYGRNINFSVSYAFN